MLKREVEPFISNIFIFNSNADLLSPGDTNFM